MNTNFNVCLLLNFLMCSLVGLFMTTASGACGSCLACYQLWTRSRRERELLTITPWPSAEEGHRKQWVQQIFDHQLNLVGLHRHHQVRNCLAQGRLSPGLSEVVRPKPDCRIPPLYQLLRCWIHNSNSGPSMKCSPCYLASQLMALARIYAWPTFCHPLISWSTFPQHGRRRHRHPMFYSSFLGGFA